MDRLGLVGRQVDRQSDRKTELKNKTQNRLGDYCTAVNKTNGREELPGHILAFSAEPMTSLGPWLLRQQPI